ncbi:MAG: AAA family ATPase [Clostridium sp.]|nr:AAA family ATPase [Clostridium sp.]
MAYLVGIAGGTASGKSTFSDQLRKLLCELGWNVKILHMDHYFRPENERPFTEAFISGKKYMDDNHPLTVDLDTLKNDIQINIEEGEYDVIIVEGLLTLWDNEIYHKLDLRIYIDCKSDERIVRRIKRNMEWGLTLEQITNVYLDMVRYRHDEYVEPSKWRAEIIINGSHSTKASLQMIKEYINVNCRKGK